jgi:hypothetical protein
MLLIDFIKIYIRVRGHERAAVRLQTASDLDFAVLEE